MGEACFERAVEKGFGNTQWIEHGGDFDPLHDHPRLRERLARL
jgi:hypothetical protein